jgi:hypothetical protein
MLRAYRWELAEQVGRHFESYRSTTPISTMLVLALPKWAKFNELTRHSKLYQEFPTRTHLLTRRSVDDPTQQEVVAPAPWHVQLWLVDVDCAFYNPPPTTISDEPTSVLVPPNVPEESIATVRHFSPEAPARSMDLTEARPLIRIEMTVKTPNGGHLISGLVCIVATLDFVSEDFARRFDLQTSKSQTKTPLPVSTRSP